MGLSSCLCFCWFKGRMERGWSGPLALNRSFMRGLPAQQLLGRMLIRQLFLNPVRPGAKGQQRQWGRLNKLFPLPLHPDPDHPSLALGYGAPRATYQRGLVVRSSLACNPVWDQGVPSTSQFTTEGVPVPAPFCSELPNGPILQVGKLRHGAVW